MTTLYGIPNCDTVKKARTWLESNGVDYTFHDFGRIPADSCDKIDFIFVTPQIKVESSYIPQEAEEAGQFLSDHNPEVVHLSF